MRIRAAAALIASVTLWVGVAAATAPEAPVQAAAVVVVHQATYTDASGTAWAWVSAEAGFEPIGAN